MPNCAKTSTARHRPYINMAKSSHFHRYVPTLENHRKIIGFSPLCTGDGGRAVFWHNWALSYSPTLENHRQIIAIAIVVAININMAIVIEKTWSSSLSSSLSKHGNGDGKIIVNGNGNGHVWAMDGVNVGYINMAKSSHFHRYVRATAGG